MKAFKRVVYFLLIICVTTQLTGCWNYRDIDQLTLVAGISIDKIEGKKGFEVSMEIINYNKGKKGSPSEVISSQGKTLFDAIRNTIKITGYKLYFGHTKAFIISQEVAQEGIEEVIDFIVRDHELRMDINLLVSKEKKAKDIFNQKSITNPIRSYEIDQILAQQKFLSKAVKVQAYKFSNDLSAEGISAVLPTVRQIKFNGDTITEVIGTAVFFQDSLKGFLDDNETKAYLFVKGEVKGGIYVVQDSKEEQLAKYALVIYKNNTKISPKIVDGELVMNVDIKLRTAIGETTTYTDYISNKENRGKLIKDAEKKIKEDVQNVIRKVQKQYKADIFGFGNIVKIKEPKLWKQIGANWASSEFVDLPVNVKVEISIVGSGLASKPMEYGD